MRLISPVVLLFVCSLLQAQERLVTAVPLVSGLDRPVAIAHVRDGSGRLFLVEQTGWVWIFRDGGLLR